MWAPLLYYLLVLPISYLPIQILYGVSNFMAFIFINVYPYRGEVLNQNLKKSFPDLNESEIKVLRTRFYHHFSDLLVESIKNITASEKFLKSRLKIENPELIQEFYDKSQSVLLVSGHYNNWEYLIAAQNFLLPHQAVGIGMPLSNKFWDEKLNHQRQRFGMRVIHSGNVYEKMDAFRNEVTATLVLADQSPSNSKKSYWMDFLNQKTAVLFGAELLARKYNYPVVFFEIQKVKRGHYTIRFETLSETPQTEPYGQITEAHTRKLEKLIINAPEYWVWTHKRWKREVPEDLEGLRAAQEEKFLSKFGATKKA